MLTYLEFIKESVINLQAPEVDLEQKEMELLKTEEDKKLKIILSYIQKALNPLEDLKTIMHEHKMLDDKLIDKIINDLNLLSKQIENIDNK